MNGADTLLGSLGSVQRADCAVGRDRVPEAAELERPDLVGLDPAVGEAVRRLAHEDLARRCSLLEPRSDVHRLAGREGRVGLVDHHLAGLDTDAGLEAELTSVLEDPEAGPDRALGVVLVRQGNAECGHDGISGELLDRSSMRLDAAGDTVEEGRDPAAGDLGILSGNELGRSDEICEQHCGELSLHTQILGMTSGGKSGRETDSE